MYPLKALMFSMKRPSKWPCLSPMELHIMTSNASLKCYPFGISIQKRLHSVIRSAVALRSERIEFLMGNGGI